MSSLVVDIPVRIAVGAYSSLSGLAAGIGRGCVGLFRLSLRQYVMLIVAVAFVAFSGLQLNGLDVMRSVLRGPTIVGDAIEGASPPTIVLLTHALGGFKVLLIDMVWLRAIKLLNSKQFWELTQLYDWMGKLEPRLEEVWVFNGWNMAYNIVAELSESEPRWQWVARSIEWMRDEGWYKYNRRSADICREITWVFYNKIGATNDEHHNYYKHRWALIMQDLLGKEPHDWGVVEKLPQSLEGMLSSNAAVEGFASDLGERLQPNVPSAERLASVREMLRPLDQANVYRELPVRVRRALDDPKYAAARKALQEYVIARALRTVYKMDIGLMAQIEKRYGGMDWRLSDPHAIYWASVSMSIQTSRAEAVSEASIRKKYSDKTVNPGRMLFNSLKQLYRRGRIIYMDPVPTGNIVLSYDMGRVEQLHQYFIERIDEMEMDQARLNEIWRLRRARGENALIEDVLGLSTTKDSHIYFLQEAVEMLYYGGQIDKALKYFRYGQEKYDKFLASDGRKYGLEEYCLGKIRKGVTESWDLPRVLALIRGMVVRYYFLYASLNDEEAGAWFGKARAWWRYYVDDRIQNVQDRVKIEQMGLPTFEQISRSVLYDVLTQQVGFPEFLRGRLRERLNLPADWEQKAAAEMGVPGESEAKLRADAYKESISPLHPPKAKSAVEEEEERRQKEAEEQRKKEQDKREERMREGVF